MQHRTFKELKAFIDRQPSDRPINMNESTSASDCGCILVHFAKEVCGMPNFGCGWSTANPPDNIDHTNMLRFDDPGLVSSVISLCAHLYREVTSYDKARAIIKNHFPQL